MKGLRVMNTRTRQYGTVRGESAQRIDHSPNDFYIFWQLLVELEGLGTLHVWQHTEVQVTELGAPGPAES